VGRTSDAGLGTRHAAQVSGAGGSVRPDGQTPLVYHCHYIMDVMVIKKIKNNFKILKKG
jgi:hypothetical protein